MKEDRMTEFLERPGKPRIAYHKISGHESSAYVIFMPGFRSDMQGTKATFLQEVCAEQGLGYIRFDYSGHGESGGDFTEGTIGTWCEDTLAVLDNLTDGKPLVLIGSSMGGWIALLCALRRAERVKAVIGLAAAPDFTTGIEQKMTDHQREEMSRKGYIEVANEYSPEPYIFTKALIEEGAKNCVLEGVLEMQAPLHLIQGKKDTDVHWETAEQIMEVYDGPECTVTYIEDGDHSLSRPEDLEILKDQLLDLI